MTNFRTRAEQALEETGAPASFRSVIEKELLHYEILFALRTSPMFGRLTFQGGTALRLCYGSRRYSEDLDFAVGPDFDPADFAGLASIIRKRIADEQGLEVEIIEPKPRRHDQKVAVDTWKIRVVTAPERPDIPKQRIHLEFASIPAYSREVRALRRNYTSLPSGYEELRVNVETMDEILDDKLKALVSASPERVRYRDLWDIPWLLQQGATFTVEQVKQKVADYGVEDFPAALEYTLEHLSDCIHGGFVAEMGRFIPPSVAARTLEQPGFLDALASENRRALEQVRQGLSPKPGPLFPM